LYQALDPIFLAEDKAINAKENFEKASQMKKKFHILLAGTFNNLSLVFWIQGYALRALNIYEQGLEILKQIYGEQHALVATTLVHSIRAKAVEEALELYEKALEIRQNVLGKNHVFVADTLHNVAVLRDSQNNKKMQESERMNSFQRRMKSIPKLTERIIRTPSIPSQVLTKPENDVNKAKDSFPIFFCSSFSSLHEVLLVLRNFHCIARNGKRREKVRVASSCFAREQ